MISKKYRILIILVLAALLLPGAFAAYISQTYTFTEPKISSVVIGNTSYDSITIEGLDSYANPGEPKLPFKQINILVPPGATVTGVAVNPYNEIKMQGVYRVEIGQKPIPLLPDYELAKRGYKKELLDIKPEIKQAQKFGKLFSSYSMQKLTGYNIVTLNLYPVKYNPNQGLLSYYAKIFVTVSYILPSTPSSTLKATTFRGLLHDRDKLRMVVDNPDAAQAYTPRYTFKELNKPTIAGRAFAMVGMALSVNRPRLITPGTSEQYDYIIITSREFADAKGEFTFQALAAWKAAKGLKTKIVTVEDIYDQYTGFDNAEKIRNFLKDAYLNWNIQYVLLGGDADGANVGGESGNNIIPVRLLWVQPQDPGWQSIASDVYYSNLDGTFDYNNNHIYGEPNDGENGQEVDLYADVFVGRAPVDSAGEVSNFVRKTIQYESAVASNAPWLMNDLLVGENLGWSTASIYMNEIRDGSTNYNYETEGLPESMNTNTLYDLVSGYGDGTDYSWDKQELITKINTGGNSEYNHLGHASTCYVMKLCNAPQAGGGYCSGEGVSDIDNLANPEPFFAYSQGCFPGAFDNWNYEGMYTTCDSASEHFVLGGNGAFAAIMNSRYGWGEYFPSTDGPSQRHHRRFIDAIYGKGVANLGKANAMAKEGLIGYLSQDAISMRGIYWETNLIGDPETAMYLPPKPEHDLKLSGIDVKGAIVNRPATISVSIKNIGKNNESGSSLSLIMDGNPIEPFAVETIAPNEVVNIPINYTFTHGGEAVIQAAIENPLDEIPGNNKASKAIMVAEVAFTDQYSEEAIDTNGNGLYDILRIKIGVISTESKKAFIQGELTGEGPWSRIDAFWNEITIGGEQSIDVDINGMRISSSWTDGPYYLKNLKLFNDQNVLQDSRVDAYTTQPYSFQDFEPAKDISVDFNYLDSKKRVVDQKTQIGLTITNLQSSSLAEPIQLSFYEGLIHWNDSGEVRDLQLVSRKQVMPPEGYNSKYVDLEWTPTVPGQRFLFAVANISGDMNPYNNKAYKDYFSAAPSKIVNTGSSDIKGYLLVKVQVPDQNSEWPTWVDKQTILDDAATGTRRTIPAKGQFDITKVTPGIKADSYGCTNVFCLQRIYAALTTRDGKVITSEDGTAFEASSEYYVYTMKGSKEDVSKAFKAFEASKKS